MKKVNKTKCEIEFCKNTAVKRIDGVNVCMECLTDLKVYAMFDWLLLNKPKKEE